MSFPTTSVLDSFTRANSGTLGSNWTTSSNTNWGNDQLSISSNAAVNAVQNNGGAAFWNVSTFSGILEAYVTVSNVPSGGSAGPLFITAIGTYTGYLLNVNTNLNEVRLFRASATTQSTLTTISQTVNPGDTLGMTLDTSGNFTIYYKPSGGSWGSIGTVSDTTYSCSVIGVYINNGDTLTNFGGGTQVSAAGNLTISCTVEFQLINVTGVL